MELDFLGEVSLPIAVLLAVAAAIALAVITAMVVGTEKTLLAIAALCPIVVWLGAQELHDGGALNAFLAWVSNRTLSEWIVLTIVVGAFSGLVWHQSESPIVTGCFVPLTAALGLLAGYTLYATSLDVAWQLTGPALMGAAATLGATVSTWLLVALLRAAPQQVD
jgi:hypothetical protein